MYRTTPAEMTARARSMRKEPTTAERILWRALRDRQLQAKVRRQVPYGPYILDFAFLKDRLVVECDGGQHAGSDYDQRRDAWLRSKGFQVLRFSNRDVLCELEAVLTTIAQALEQSPDRTPT